MSSKGKSPIYKIDYIKLIDINFDSGSIKKLEKKDYKKEVNTKVSLGIGKEKKSLLFEVEIKILSPSKQKKMLANIKTEILFSFIKKVPLVNKNNQFILRKLLLKEILITTFSLISGIWVSKSSEVSENISMLPTFDFDRMIQNLSNKKMSLSPK